MNDDRKSPAPVKVPRVGPVGPALASLMLLIGFLGVVLIMLGLESCAPRSFGASRTAYEQNLRAIQGAKEAWAQDYHKWNSDVPTDADLFGPDRYIREKPLCPKDGFYSLNCVTNRPTCSREDHKF